MGSFEDVVVHAYAVNAVAFFIGVFIAVGAIVSLNDQNWVGVFLTLPLATLAMLSSFLLSISWMAISWQAERPVCFTADPSRELLVFVKQHYLAWGLAQYLMLAVVAGMMLFAMGYRYLKPLNNRNEQSLHRKFSKRERFGLMVSAVLTLCRSSYSPRLYGQNGR